MEDDNRPKTSRPPATGESIRPVTAAVKIQRDDPTSHSTHELPKIIAEQPGDDDDEGMFSFLPPTAESNPAPTAESQHIPVNSATTSMHSTAAAYANAFAQMQADKKAGRSSRNSHRNSSGRHRSSYLSPSSPSFTQSYLENTPYENLPPSAWSQGYSVGSARSPVITLDSQFRRAQQTAESDVDSYSHIQPSRKGSDTYPVGGLPGGELGYEKDVHESSSEEDKVPDAEGYDGQDPLDMLSQYGEEEEDSPFPEVRASVSNIDDPEMPCLTARSWILGLVFTCVCSALNIFFNLRYPSPYITSVLVQILTYPAGKVMAAYLPTRSFRNPSWLQRWTGCGSEWSLNPGPFNIKEHTVMVIMANASITPAYALNLTLVLDKYYLTPKGIGFDLLLVISTQMLGFSLAGMCRRFLVWPAGMIWPENLVTCTLLNTFHAEDDDGRDGSMTRYKFFSIVLIAAGAYYILPGEFYQ